MDSESKKPGAPFWITVALIVMLVLYPLSFGPYLWFHFRFQEIEPHWIDEATDIVFAPQVWLYGNSLGPPSKWYTNYLDWWIRLGQTR